MSDPSQRRGAPGSRAREVFGDAVAAWHMADLRDSRGSPDLEALGAIDIGVDLEGDEREASLLRGGDAKAAVFHGGTLATGRGGTREVALAGHDASLCMRLRLTETVEGSSILARDDRGDGLGRILHLGSVDRRQMNYESSRRVSDGTTVEFAWRTRPLEERVLPTFFQAPWYEFLHRARGQDLLDGILRLSAPLDLIGRRSWHDVIVRCTRCRLELFVDGVLVDEEWPHGELHRFEGPFLLGGRRAGGEIEAGFRGLMDHAALWNRALADEEIEALSGGRETVAHRELEILGPEPQGLQYWVPRGHNTFVGDTMPFFHEGTLHLYYLLDRRRHLSKWGMGAHQFAHASSEDLVHWKHHPLALPITEPWECSLGTGCHVERDGTIYQYYIHHGKRGFFTDAPVRGETILVSTSTDGVHFAKDHRPLVSMDYREFNDVNPDVFPDASSGGYWLSISGWKVFESNDLARWKETTRLRCPEDVPRGICCSIFSWNGWSYFMWDNGSYRFSRDPVGPGWRWSQPAHPSTAEGLGVPKVAAFRGGRRIMTGFLRGEAYAGELVVRELVQNHDGTLGTRFPPEMIPAAGPAITVAPREVTLGAPGREATRVTAGVPGDALVTLRVVPGDGDGSYGMVVGADQAGRGGCELLFDPARGGVSLQSRREGGQGVDVLGHPTIDSRIGGVEGLDRPFSLELIVKDDLVDLCIDQRRTLVARRTDDARGRCLCLFGRSRTVTFERLEVRPLERTRA
jgi:beta-fructofuranosidase